MALVRREIGGGISIFPVPNCPYGVPGDRLWVREVWAVEQSLNLFRPNDLIPDESVVEYGADNELSKPAPSFCRGRWRPGIFMPRWASRITLEVVSVRAGQLCQISEADAKAEGTDCRSDLSWGGGRGDDMPRWAVAHGHRADFERLWKSIHGEPSWNDNPWVWVVEFRRVTS
jgi:hypothetical protein